MRLLDLAPGGVCLAADIATNAGKLLPYRFTLAPSGAISSLLHYAVRLPCLAVSQRRALWSADFPQLARRRTAIPWLTSPALYAHVPGVGKADSALHRTTGHALCSAPGRRRSNGCQGMLTSLQ